MNADETKPSSLFSIGVHPRLSAASYVLVFFPATSEECGYKALQAEFDDQVPMRRLDRQPHRETSVAIGASIETGRSEGFLAARSITTIHYLVQRELGVARPPR
jgi:hypothetical protein